MQKFTANFGIGKNQENVRIGGLIGSPRLLLILLSRRVPDFESFHWIWTR